MGIESPVHLLFIGAVALLVLGPKRLPEVARALGKGLREFREAMGEQPPARAAPANETLQPAIRPAAQPGAPSVLGSVFDLEPSAQVARIDHGAQAASSAPPGPAQQPPADIDLARPVPVPPGPAQQPPADVDPARQVRSDGAPDRRPL